MTENEDGLQLEAREGVLIMRIVRPARRNAIDHRTAVLIDEALDRLDRDPALRVGVITGSSAGFSAGMDLKAFAGGEPMPFTENRGFAGIVERPSAKPLVAAVERFALAGGLEIALACDLIVSGRSAVFGVPEVQRGLVAAGGGIRRLPDRVPIGVAREMLFTGATVAADRALATGLVDRLVDDGDAEAAGVAWAAEIAACAPLAVGVSKAVLDRQRDWPDAEFWSRQEQLVRPVFDSQDAREGAVAFAERRPPRWRGH